ncbi:MAG TPA: bifunctional methylenetetrahydrofolate dehydrogenase/methenyltetrahydrofolate cyclohydrolase FolD [Myxococcaceae bacterium]|nr:bifunctional methylenetetrahydrofolate dehydrogenase/methenyltetrahydrofolate cyclohydrolase FolD [Myxococcaceae bacterium]
MNMATLIDGKAIAAKVRAEVAEGVAAMKARHGMVPGLAVMRIGEDPASKIYVTSKRKVAGELGFHALEVHLPEDASQATALERLAALNSDPAIHGILVQLPVPKQIDSDALLAALRPEKDADGLHAVNAGLLAQGREATLPCTPWGVMRMLEEIGFQPTGRRAVVVGRSILVGRPMALMLLNVSATVTICHRKSNLAEEVARGDLVVVAAGAPELVKGAWIKPGAVVIDVGMNRMPDGKLVGDVEFAAAAERASAISPVPGGVGPMTIAMLMKNALRNAERMLRRPP